MAAAGEKGVVREDEGQEGKREASSLTSSPSSIL